MGPVGGGAFTQHGWAKAHRRKGEHTRRNHRERVFHDFFFRFGGGGFRVTSHHGGRGAVAC